MKIQSFITNDEINECIARRGSGVSEGKLRIYQYFDEHSQLKDRISFLKNEYGIGGGSHALSGSSGSDESHDAKGQQFKKKGCQKIQLSWSEISKRIESLIKADRYLTEEEKATIHQRATKAAAVDDAADLSDEITHIADEIEKVEQDNAVVDEEPVKSDSLVNQYNSMKEENPDCIALIQVGDFFEAYGEDAKAVSEKLDLVLTSRNLPDVGRVDMCGFPSHKLKDYLDVILEDGDVVINAIPDGKTERETFRMISHDKVLEKEAEQVFRSPEGKEYSIGDKIDFYASDGGGTRFVINSVDEDTVFYTFDELPNQSPVGMPRERFEAYLDKATFAVVDEDISAEKADNDFSDLIPGETTFYHNGRQYLVDRVNVETGTVN